MRILIALAVAVAIVTIPTAIAAIPSSDGTIHGCYGKPGTPQKGELRVVNADQGEACRYYENPLAWSQTGPPGPAGATGPAGPTGATGPTGPSGVADLHWEPFCRSNASPRELDPQPCTRVQLATGWYNVHIPQRLG